MLLLLYEIVIRGELSNSSIVWRYKTNIFNVYSHITYKFGVMIYSNSTATNKLIKGETEKSILVNDILGQSSNVVKRKKYLLFAMRLKIVLNVLLEGSILKKYYLP